MRNTFKHRTEKVLTKGGTLPLVFEQFTVMGQRLSALSIDVECIIEFLFPLIYSLL